MMKNKIILFLCTGNYFRSRFAEYYFNHFAKDLLWTAESRGLAIDTYANAGPISGHTVQELKKSGIIVNNPRFPLTAKEEDFQNAEKIIALNKIEHEPMIAKKFPRWKNEVIYWNIGDLDVESFQEAFEKMKPLLDDLIEKLRKQPEN